MIICVFMSFLCTALAANLSQFSLPVDLLCCCCCVFVSGAIYISFFALYRPIDCFATAIFPRVGVVGLLVVPCSVVYNLNDHKPYFWCFYMVDYVHTAYYAVHSTSPVRVK